MSPRSITVRSQTRGGKFHEAPSLFHGAVDFVIDIINQSKVASPEIEAVYFYWTTEWRVSGS